MPDKITVYLNRFCSMDLDSRHGVPDQIPGLLFSTPEEVRGDSQIGSPRIVRYAQRRKAGAKKSASRLKDKISAITGSVTDDNRVTCQIFL